MADPAVNALEDLALEGKRSFSRVRNTMLKTGDMFLFGKPTSELLHIMTKMYHENIVKNLFFLDKDKYISSTVKGGLPATKAKNMGFMCALIDMGADQPADKRFFMTISEAPAMGGRVENANFDNKEKLALQLLRSSNMVVRGVEDEFREPDINLAWRLPGGAGVLNPAAYNKNISIQGLPAEQNFIMKRDMLINDPAAGAKGMNYDDDLWKAPYEINFVNSYQYLHDRVEKGKSFVPFKKYDDEKDQVECNNGSTCCEAKLFSYVRNNLGKTFDDIRGFAVFWVGVNLPPAHHIQNYCYSPWKEGEDRKLGELKTKCVEILSPEIKAKYPPEKLDSVMTHVAQSIAMACPGCMSNYQAYKAGKIDTWNPAPCYTHVNVRTTRKNRMRAARDMNLAKREEERLVRRQESTRRLAEGAPLHEVPPPRGRRLSVNAAFPRSPRPRLPSKSARRAQSARRRREDDLLDTLAGVPPGSPSPGGGGRTRRARRKLKGRGT